MRTRLVCFAILAVLLAAVPRLAVSQQGSAESKTAASSQPAPKRYYKLNFVLRETDEGKVLNQRAFSMNVAADPSAWWNLRSGTRFPIPDSKAAGISYVDVGVNLDLRAVEFGDGLQVEVTSEISSAPVDGGPGAAAPVIRQVKVRSALWAPMGKPSMVFTADDASSKHRFELEVTPVREK